MKHTFILVLADSALDYLASLRLFPNVDAAILEKEIYLRIKTNEKVVPVNIRKLPAKSTYLLKEEELLFPLGGEVPIGRLPKLTWKPLADFIYVEPPTSAMPGDSKSFRMVNLVEAEGPKETEGLLTSFQHWQPYVEGAPNFRLNKLKYALAQDGQVLIWGRPLPPIPGVEYWKSHQLLIPAGMELEFPVLSSVVSKKMASQNEDLILFDRHGKYQKISLTHFVPASRSSVRVSKTDIS